MTNLLTLMHTTRQVSPAQVVTGRNGLSAGLSLPAEEFFDPLVATRAVEDTAWVLLAGLACS